MTVANPLRAENLRHFRLKLAVHRIRGEWFHPHQDVMGAFHIS